MMTASRQASILLWKGMAENDDDNDGNGTITITGIGPGWKQICLSEV